MRFRHLEAEPVLAWLRAAPADIRIREWERERTPGGIAGFLRLAQAEPANPARPGKLSEIEFVAGRGRGPSHASTVLRYYFHINSTAEEVILPLVEAVAYVEGRGADTECLLAGHPDGGLVSVSRVRLPFQQGETIAWWGP